MAAASVESGAVPLRRESHWIHYMYGPDWALPSISPKCLALKLYLAFEGVRIAENHCNNPSMVAPEAGLPVLANTSTGRVAWDITNIVEWLADNQIGSPLSTLNPADTAKTVELSGLLEAALEPALLYNWYVEDQNFPVVAHAFTKHLSFPAAGIEAKQLRDKARSKLDAMGLLDGRIVYGRAAAAYGALAFELAKSTNPASSSSSSSKKRWLLGDTPQLIDALIIGHLALALHAPMDPQASKLLALVQEHPVLVSYANDALRIFLRNAPTDLPHTSFPLPFPERMENTWTSARSFLSSGASMTLVTLGIFGIVMYAGMKDYIPSRQQLFEFIRS